MEIRLHFQSFNEVDHNPQQTGAGFSRGYQQSEAKDGTVSPGHCFKQATQSHCLLRPSLVESVFLDYLVLS